MRQDERPSTWGTSSTLIERVKAEEKEAWDSLCDIYAPLVYSWARKSRLQESDAEDIVQEVFRRVSIGFKSFQYGGPDDSFRGWLWTITRNALRKYFNKLGADVVNAEGGTNALQRIGEIPDELPEKEPEIDASEESAMMRRALTLIEQDFNEHTWKAFWQFAVEGKSASDVGEEFAMTAQAVRQAKYRVLARLREVLG